MIIGQSAVLPINKTQLDEGKYFVKQKKYLNIIGAVLFFLALLKLRAGLYIRELPLYGGMLIVGIACVMIAQKIKVVKENTGEANPSLSDQWKCSCGSYNNQSDLFCKNCGMKKLSN